MDEISNKTLATLLVVAIVISLAGTFFAMRGVSQITNIVSGSAVTTGTAKVNVTETASITLTQATVSFGTGYRNASAVVVTSECNLTTQQTNNPPGCWINVTEFAPIPFNLMNDGSVYVNVTINSSNATSFLYGTPTAGIQRYQWTASDADQGQFLGGDDGCVGIMSGTDWTEFNELEQLVCTNMSPYDAGDELKVDVNISIPAGIANNYTATVTFYGIKSMQ